MLWRATCSMNSQPGVLMHVTQALHRLLQQEPDRELTVYKPV
jgi:hypothetical protein